MNLSISTNHNHLLYWLAAGLLFMSFGLGDAAVIAWCMSLVNLGQLIAAVFSFLLIEIGVFVTIWQMGREPK